MELQRPVQNSWHIKKMNFGDIKSRFLKKHLKPLTVPLQISKMCTCINFNEIFIKSILFKTDMAIIENSDADAVLAVYPFTPSFHIIKNIIDFSGKPVICRVGGRITRGKTSLRIACEAEQAGACALIVNQPFKNRHIEQIKKALRLPLVSSFSTSNFSFKDRVSARIDIFNVTGGFNTPEIIEKINYAVPGISVMATGEKSIESITSVIMAGAGAVVLTPPSSGDLFKSIVERYRQGLNYK